MPNIQTVWVVPDLALVVCPRDQDFYDQHFFENLWQRFLQHDAILTTCGFHWCLSDALIISLQGEFPFAWLETKIAWVMDFYDDFFGFWDRKERIPVDAYPQCTLQPDIVPTFVTDDTRQAWLDTLATCAYQDATLSCVASHTDQPIITLQVNPDNASLVAVRVVRHSKEWQGVYKQVNPWVAAGLPEPKQGSYAYNPPATWQQGQPFPKAVTPRGYGFLDTNQNVWMWDKAEEHWDVQHSPYGRDNYTRVTRDGRVIS